MISLMWNLKKPKRYREQIGACHLQWMRVGKMGEGEWEIQASGYGMNKLWE